MPKTSILFMLYFLILMVLGASLAAAQTIEQRVIAITGDHLPGTPEGTTVALLGTPSVGKRGDLVFVAWLQGEGVTAANDTGIWRLPKGGSLEMIARAGDPAPGASPGEVFDEIQRPNINAHGRVAFNATLAGPDITELNNVGIWSDATSAGIELVARLGSSAPGTEAGTVFSSFGSDYGLAVNVPCLSDSGAIILACELAGVGIDEENDTGIWVGSSDALELILRAGDPIPGQGGDLRFGRVGSCLINSSNEVATGGNIIGPGVNPNNEWAVHVKRLGQDWNMVLRSGAAAPGVPGDHTLRSVSVFAMNDEGQLAIHGRLISDVYTSPGDGASWLESPNGELTLYMYKLQTAPWIEKDYHFEYVNSASIPVGGRGSQYAVVTTGDAVENYGGLWLVSDQGEIGLFHYEGEPAVGAPAGVSYRSFSTKSGNKYGMTVLRIWLQGDGVTESNDLGLWIGRTLNDEMYLARTGDLIDVNNDPVLTDMRTVADLHILLGGGGQDGRRRSISDTNQVGYRAAFTDGSIAVMLASLLCPSDTNHDGMLTPADFTAWIAAFNADAPECDQNGDGMCTPADFTAWIANFNAGC